MKISKLFCVLFLGLFLMAVVVGDARAQKGKPQPPPPTPSNPAIAYTAPGQSQSRWDLKVMDANGSNQRVVFARKFTQNVEPDWSPDGRQLVFTSDDLMGTADGLYIINVDGSGLRKIASTGPPANPAWSPVELAGRYWIAFSGRARLEDGTFKADRDIFLVDVNGNNLTQLTNTSVGEGGVEWSPAGDRIAVGTYDPVSGTSDIVLYRVDCVDTGCGAGYLGSVIDVPNSPLKGKDAGGTAWARAKDILVVSAQTGADGSYDLWSITLGNPIVFEQLTNTLAASEHDISWLPDDSQVAFVRGPEGGLWTMNFAPNPDGTRDLHLIMMPRQAGISFFWTVQWRRNP